jgi:hypothetical protein
LGFGWLLGSADKLTRLLIKQAKTGENTNAFDQDLISAYLKEKQGANQEKNVFTQSTQRAQRVILDSGSCPE